MTARFLFGGFGISVGFVKFEVAPTSMTEYAIAVTTILAVWLGREWIQNQPGGSNNKP